MPHWLDTPLRESWPFLGLPRRVVLFDRQFEKARWARDLDGVVAQYRERRARDSAHASVFANGTVVIDHLDRFNPDAGAMLRHFFVDTAEGRVVGGLLAVGAVVAVVAWLRGTSAPS